MLRYTFSVSLQTCYPSTDPETTRLVYWIWTVWLGLQKSTFLDIWPSCLGWQPGVRDAQLCLKIIVKSLVRSHCVNISFLWSLTKFENIQIIGSYSIYYWWLVELPKRFKWGYAWMFEPILMDFWDLLSAERSPINVETEPRAYCCGGGGIFMRTQRVACV